MRDPKTGELSSDIDVLLEKLKDAAEAIRKEAEQLDSLAEQLIQLRTTSLNKSKNKKDAE